MTTRRRHAPAPRPTASLWAARYRDLFVGAGLVALVAVAFAGVLDAGFIRNGDDSDYVLQNPYVRHGLTWAGARWAMTAFDAYNWHPLTWLSLQLDAQLFGVKHAWGFHLTNLLLHAANVVTLYAALRVMTGAVWRSVLVAALFAVHPLRVESVAWVSERKDVLSALFWMLTLLAYAGYARRPSVVRYGTVVLLFALGLTAKPMLVTLPFVLLLLDYWPLRRCAFWGRERPPTFAPTSLLRLIVEKIPLLILSAGCSAATVAAQQEIVQKVEHFPLDLRVENALTVYVRYVTKLLWPTDLAFHYPHPGDQLIAWQATAAGLILAAITIMALVTARRWPYLVVGWLWYLGTLVPVIGLVQVGQQAMADRYTYLPTIGLGIALIWGLADAVARWRIYPALSAAAAAVVLAGCVALTRVQVGHWREDLTLWEHTLHVTSENSVAHYELGFALAQAGRLDEAIAQYRAALALQPEYGAVYVYLGIALARRGDPEGAIQELREALRLQPENAMAYNNLGLVLSSQGKTDAAIECFAHAVRIDPGYEVARHNLAALRARRRAADIAHPGK